MSAPIRVYNSLTRALAPLQTHTPGQVTLYACGMTVYDLCHIGHARAMLTFDVVVRYLRARGWKVNFVRNHTDIDDKIIARAAREGRDALEVSEHFIQALDADLDALGLIRPDVAPKVSESIPEILEMIQKLLDRGHAYVTADGDVCYAVESFEGYGKLSGKKLEDLRAGERVAVDSSKRHPGDFALWKAAGHPATLSGADVAWDSPWGPGRPGWHIECSAMSCRHLGAQIDIHGGGIDLIFPHHENEIAQTEGATGLAPFATVWMHNGHLTLVDRDGGHLKMSKSLGNTIQIRDLLTRFPAEAIRHLFLETHYRSPLPYSEDRLEGALAALDRLYQAKETALALVGAQEGELSSPVAKELETAAFSFRKRFCAAMDEDFATGDAITLLFELVRLTNRFGNDKKARARGAKLAAPLLEAFALCAEVLGIGGMSPEDFFLEVRKKRLAVQGIEESKVEALLTARTDARAAKEWARADEIRAELDALGVIVMDGAAGSTWRVRVGEAG